MAHCEIEYILEYYDLFMFWRSYAGHGVDHSISMIRYMEDQMYDSHTQSCLRMSMLFTFLNALIPWLSTHLDLDPLYINRSVHFNATLRITRSFLFELVYVYSSWSDKLSLSDLGDLLLEQTIISLILTS
jgi:hypothetical protein